MKLNEALSLILTIVGLLISGGVVKYILNCRVKKLQEKKDLVNLVTTLNTSVIALSAKLDKLTEIVINMQNDNEKQKEFNKKVKAFKDYLTIKAGDILRYRHKNIDSGLRTLLLSGLDATKKFYDQLAEEYYYGTLIKKSEQEINDIVKVTIDGLDTIATLHCSDAFVENIKEESEIETLIEIFQHDIYIAINRNEDITRCETDGTYTNDVCKLIIKFLEQMFMSAININSKINKDEL